MHKKNSEVKIIKVEDQGTGTYPRQEDPKDCSIELNLEENTLSVNMEGKCLSEDCRGIIRRYEIPLILGSSANDLMYKILPLAERIVAGGSTVRDGRNLLAELNDDAKKADGEIKKICSEVQGAEIVSCEADDFCREFSNEDLGVEVGMNISKATCKLERELYPTEGADGYLTYVLDICKYIEKRLEELTKAARNVIAGYDPDRELQDLSRGRRIENRVNLMKAVIEVAREDELDLSKIRRELPKEWKDDFDEAKKEIMGKDENVNARDEDGPTLLHDVETAPRASVLINAGANINARDNNGCTPLHYAKNAEILSLLIKAGANVNVRDKKGKTPLHLQHKPGSVKILVKVGANVNVRDNDGKTPLHYQTYFDPFRFLVEAGADVNARDENGKTPLFFRKYIPEEVKLLFSYGATDEKNEVRNSLDLNERKAFDIAKAAGLKEREQNDSLTGEREKPRTCRNPWHTPGRNANDDVENTKKVYETAKLWLEMKRDGAPMSERNDLRSALDDTLYGMEEFFNGWVYDHLPVKTLADSTLKAQKIEDEKWGNSFYKWYSYDRCGIDLFYPDEDGAQQVESVDQVMHVFLDEDEVVVKNSYVNRERREPVSEVFEEYYEKALEEALNKSSENNSVELDSWNVPMPKLKKMIEETWNEILEQVADHDFSALESAIEYKDGEEIVKITNLFGRGTRFDLLDELQPEQIPDFMEAVIGYAEESDNIMRRQVEEELSRFGDFDDAFRRYVDNKLFKAVYGENIDGVRDALRNGADVNAKDNDGKTLLHWRSDPESVKALLEAGADVNAKDNRGRTPLHQQVYPGSVKVLIQAGANVNVKDQNGYTPLHFSCYPESVKALIQSGGDVNVKNNFGDTPLHHENKPEKIKIFVEAGADTNAVNNNGETPLHSVKYNPLAVQALFACGAKDKDNEIRKSLAPNNRKIFDKAKAAGMKELKGKEQNCRERYYC